MPVRVKICGITSIADALLAAEAGADAVGFMFSEQSPRAISFSLAAQIAAQLPPFITKVGVFVDAPARQVRQAIELCGLNALQFHGAESPKACAGWSLPMIKAFRVENAASISNLSEFATAAWLLDSFVPGQFGGTGAQFNWDIAVQAKSYGRPIILAGGLTPENVAQAVERVSPYCVDVSSGVESAPGKKDAQKVKAFVARAKSVSM
ncbi:MAG TPA: phosphoribosylanthranilate isomerase [Verrucomicrobiae bacterium]